MTKNLNVDHVLFGYEDVLVAMWVIGGAYAMGWMGSICWWQQRKKKAMKRLTEAVMEVEVAR
ncbi:hypothetical protein [Luteolibacter soli]|uniref:Heme exporter protein D n=1 Tax=Luteolibacter soli TaxID=3135280 RepID=A0ABU9AV93_9BACT